MEQFYRHLIDISITKAAVYNSKLPMELYALDGMSGFMTRCLYNNICSIKGVRYLEIGCWKGSTLCSSFYGNHGSFIGIDDFSEFGENREELLNNINTFKTPDANVQFIDANCFELDVQTLPHKFNVFLYDGNHEYESHFKAIIRYLPAMDDIFVLIVDDFNWLKVRKGTRDAISLTCEILYERELRTSHNDEYPSDENMMRKTFWNGCYVAVLKKL